MDEPDLPLSGLRVLDLSRALAGPYCAMILGDLGAEVIKIENPRGGDETRSWGPPYLASESTYFLAANRHKQSVTINLRHPDGSALIRDLADHSDILIENFERTVPLRYGIDWPSLAERNPRLIYCSISSFFPGSRYDHVAGYDLVMQAMSGLMSITGPPDGEPYKVGVAVVDVLTGLYACGAVLAALHQRQQTRKGRHLTIPLFDSAVASLVNVASGYLATGQQPGRWGNAHASLVPYQMFQAQDGHLVIGVGNDGQFQRLCAVLARPDLASDERFASNPGRVAHRENLIPILQDEIARCTATSLVAKLEEARVPAASVNTLEDVFADPYILESGLLADVSHPTVGRLNQVASPIALDGARLPLRGAPPVLGVDTEDVLERVLGMPGDRIAGLRARGVV